MSDDKFYVKFKKARPIKKFVDEHNYAKTHTPLAIMMLNDTLPFLTIIAFLLLGFLGNWWHPGWLVFFAIPIYYMLRSAIVHKSAEMVPIVPIVTVVYLCLGCIWGMWHPYWAIFVAIPLYYMIIAAIKGANWSRIFDIIVPLVAVGIFLALGFTLNAWHPGWMVFFLIPLYYTLRSTVRRYQGIIDDKDDDDDTDDDDNGPEYIIK